MTVSIADFYGRWARVYDTIATLPRVGEWRADAVQSLDLSRGDTVVDMGCGTGANIPYLRDQVGRTGHVVGIDLTPALLEQARIRIERAGWRNVSLVCGDASRPPVSRADAVLGTFVVGLLPDPAGAVELWCQLTDGRIALLDGASSHHPIGRLINPLFGACVTAGVPTDSLGETVGRLLTPTNDRQRLDASIRASRDALASHTTNRRYETFGLGFIGFLSGRSDVY
ncbi:class I SAM-dependent methyltransferase [Halocatena marina]|uniref:Class I SAM-dependent methyltransferase n=1 Tax=Halocatena marina TaxID=2934937 RepID=A0ABD5YU97_9EURY|nr:methyltransferase domain-containing protein [Halocatena marina]